MPSTYEPIFTYTIPSATTSYTFTSIPSTYTDLVLVANGGTVSDSNLNLRVGNGSIDSGSNYSQTLLNGNGSTATSSRTTSQTQWQPSNDDAYWTTTIRGLLTIHFMNYSSTSLAKTIVSRSNTATLGLNVYVGLWRSTSAINQIYFAGSSQNLIAGTTLTLYGIKAA
jgi:hypothetical protein